MLLSTRVSGGGFAAAATSLFHSRGYIPIWLLVVTLWHCAPCAVHGQWSADPAINTPVCTQAGLQQRVDGASDGSGGTFLVWMDDRINNDHHIYAQHLDATGVPLWAANGIPVCTVGSQQVFPKAISDGTGGAIFAWEDDRGTISGSDIYAQRLTGAGAISAGWPANGAVVCNLSNSQLGVRMVSDGAGGAVFVWTSQHIYAQRLTGTGAVAAGWLVNGTPVSRTTSSDQFDPQIATDGIGGAFFVWADSPTPGADLDVWAQHLTSGGAPAAGWVAGGNAVSTNDHYQSHALVAADGSGGAFFAWQDNRDAIDWDIFGQRLTSSGTIVSGWATSGTLISNLPGDQQNIQMTADTAGGCIVAWEQGPPTNRDLYAHRMNSNGTPAPGWPANGTTVCTLPGDQQQIQVVSDASGGALIVWKDPRNETVLDQENEDIYATRLTVLGGLASGWTTNGMPISTALGNQEYPIVTAQASGGATVAWQVSQFPIGILDIYASYVSAPVPAAVTQPWTLLE